MTARSLIISVSALSCSLLFSSHLTCPIISYLSIVILKQRTLMLGDLLCIVNLFYSRIPRTVLSYLFIWLCPLICNLWCAPSFSLLALHSHMSILFRVQSNKLDNKYWYQSWFNALSQERLFMLTCQTFLWPHSSDLWSVLDSAGWPRSDEIFHTAPPCHPSPAQSFRVRNAALRSCDQLGAM